MPQTYKVLGQVVPAASGLTSLYTVPTGYQAVCSTLAVCNLTDSTATYRIAVRPTGESLNNNHYLVYDSYVNFQDSIFLTLGLTLNSTDILSIYTTSSGTAFSLFGSEIS